MSSNSNPDRQAPPEGGYVLPANTIIPPGVSGPWIPNTPGVALPPGVIVPSDAVGPWAGAPTLLNIEPQLDRLTSSPGMTYTSRGGSAVVTPLQPSGPSGVALVHLQGQIVIPIGNPNPVGSGAWVIRASSGADPLPEAFDPFGNGESALGLLRRAGPLNAVWTGMSWEMQPGEDFLRILGMAGTSFGASPVTADLQPDGANTFWFSGFYFTEL